jgi:dTDP-4-dehydrorhamnose reductase
MRYLVTGAKGQVGGALAKRLGAAAIPVDVTEMDLSKPETIAAALKHYNPDVIINPAAYTAVDKAESEEALAHIINADAVREIARYAFAHNIPLVHYSTDYVFPGDGKTPWKEDDKTGPLNAYGRTKLAGEQAIIEEAAYALGREQGGERSSVARSASGSSSRLESLEGSAPKYLIFRTSWVFSEHGHNFVNTMLRLGAEREVLSVVDDQIGAPTYAGDIADATLSVLEKSIEMKRLSSVIYHLVSSGYTSWFNFAEEIFQQAAALGADLKVREVKPQATKDYPTPARRPLNSRMDCAKLERTFGIALPAWQDALYRCLKNKYGVDKPFTPKGF